MITFERELEAFERALPRLVAESNGKYAVVHGNEVSHVAPDLEAALDWAFDRFEPGEFMVKQVNANEPIAHFSRSIGPCAA